MRRRSYGSHRQKTAVARALLKRAVMKSFLALLLTLLVVVAGSRARAAEVRAAERPVQMHFDGGLGGSNFGVHAGGILLVRGTVLEGGPSLQCSYMLSSKCGFGLTAGMGLHGASRIGVDILGELGTNAYYLQHFMTADPGVSDWVPYAGGRVGVSWAFGNRANRVRTTLGLWLYAQHDLQVRDVSYTYTDPGEMDWYGRRSPSTQETVTHRVGGRDEVGLRFGVGFDLSPF